ncbi:hypothetical protein DWV78_08905 [Agathobacter rectalis]|uniref:Uncharacterized protein n=1 Tax=Agathobacter rectalis TaxID=39491 RepID=A0A413BFW3_9FIRM|nr:hypothetical protein DWV78_08905 [Agathobacter rectalis]
MKQWIISKCIKTYGNCIKKYIDKVDSRDDEIWKSIIVEADELTKKYNNCKFIKNLVMAELEEFERLHHERTK